MRLNSHRTLKVIAGAVSVAVFLFAKDSMAGPLALHDYLALNGPEPTMRFSYGGGAASQFVELFEPVGTGPFPVVFLVHGGCWSSKYAGIVQMRSMAGAMAAQGIAVWNVEYRRVDEPGGGYPGTYQDVATALDLLRSSAASHRLDLDRIVVVGHSAGGHLVQWLAGRVLLPKSSVLYQENPMRIRQVIALGSIGDLRNRLESDGTICGVPIDELIGHTSAARPDPYSDTSPAEMMPNGSHTLLINGEFDTVSPPPTAVQYATRAARVGDQVETVILRGASHYDEVAATSPAWRMVLPLIRSSLGLTR
jgi:acetyl esterase/lipase